MRGLVLFLLMAALALAIGCRSSSRQAPRAAAAPGATSITYAPRGNGGAWTTPSSSTTFSGSPAAPRGTAPVARPPLQPAQPGWTQPPLEPAPVAGDGPVDGSGVG